MNKKQIVALQKALKTLENCGGDCKHCAKCHFYSVSAERAVYYAFGCDALPEDPFSYISGTMGALHREAVDAVKFELDIAGVKL